MPRDFYALLGVERNASLSDIRAAFRHLARQYHPDVNKEPHAEERFKEINEAYQVLSDPLKRRDYDREWARAQVDEHRADAVAGQAPQGNAQQPQRSYEEVMARWKDAIRAQAQGILATIQSLMQERKQLIETIQSDLRQRRSQFTRFGAVFTLLVFILPLIPFDALFSDYYENLYPIAAGISLLLFLAAVFFAPRILNLRFISPLEILRSALNMKQGSEVLHTLLVVLGMGVFVKHPLGRCLPFTILTLYALVNLYRTATEVYAEKISHTHQTYESQIEGWARQLQELKARYGL